MLLFIIGLCSGIISGMGIGGGTILIPSLIFLAGLNQHAAQGVNLASFIPTAIVAIIIHTKNKHIKFKLALHLTLAGLIGAAAGSMAAAAMPPDMLRKLFGLFFLAMGVYELVRKENYKKVDN